MNLPLASKKLCLITVSVVLALFVMRNVELAAIRRDIVALEQQSLHPVKRDIRSPTGYQFGQRSEMLSPDGFHWAMQTQSMLAKGDLRVRSVDYDNHPEGREVHWSSSIHWWLGGLAWLFSAFGGNPTPIAVEQAAVWASPLLQLLLLVTLVPMVWRRNGGVAAGVLVLGLVVVGPFAEMFTMGDPDHHGLVAAFGMLTVLFLLYGGGGWVDGDDTKASRRWFIASGIAGGAGLWVSSATQVPVLIGIAVGVMGGVWWLGHKLQSVKSQLKQVPELWRWWGIAGAASSAFFYLLEYFPSHMGMRLEVNHPFYAIAWLGGGELLFRLTRWLTGGGFAKPGKEQVLALLAIAGVVLLPATIFLAGDSTFWVGDRLLWALHRDYIIEFCSVFRRLADVAPSRWLMTFSPLPILAGILCWRIFRSEISAVHKVRLALVLGPAMVFFGLALYQVRWSGESCALWLVVLVQVAGMAAINEARPRFSRGAKIALAVLALATVLPWMYQTAATGVSLVRGAKGFAKLNLRLGVMRDLARWLRAREGARGGVVLGGPSATTALIYFGGFKGVGTLYWENKDGLHSMVDIFSTTKDEVAHDLVVRHGITHIVVVSWDAFAAESSRLALGLRRGEEAPDNTFQARLSKGHGCPFWLRPVYYPAPEMEALKDDFVLVYEVVPEQSREEAALRYGQMVFERGEREPAEKFLGILVRHFPDYLPGWVALAQVQLSLEHKEAFQASLGRIVSLQGQTDALALDDRIGLATVLATAGDIDGMRKQIRLCVNTADEAGLRRLNANTLLCFVLFAQDTGEGASRPEIMRLATELLPSEMLKDVRAATNRR
ncbi:MAG: hypothetical protein QM715_08680 [Nibricoccus sp.]